MYGVVRNVHRAPGAHQHGSHNRVAVSETSTPTRISYVIGSLAIGGAETQLVRLVNSLDRSRFQPSIICLYPGGELQDVLAADVPVVSVDLARISHRVVRSKAALAVRMLLAIVRGLNSQRPEIVHAYLPMAYVLGGVAAWFWRVPVIIAGRRGLTSFEVYNTRRWRFLAETANRAIDLHICNSVAVRDYVIAREGIPPERTRVVHNGIDLPSPTPVPALPLAWRTEGPKAAMVANLIRYKGHREVIHAVADVTKRHPTFKLVLFGDGPERPLLTSLIRELGITDNVVLAGRQRDAATLMRAFDFTILGSSEEGFPNAVMESMACGVPVVSTAVGGVTELIDDGVHGLLVPYGNAAAMTQAILWMIEHPDRCRTMGEEARKRISDQFSTERMVSTTQAIYEQFLPRRARVTAGR